MFRHLLVPLDGSSHAEQALPVAARLAHASKGAITLVQVVDTTRKLSSSSPLEAPDARVTASENYLKQLILHPYLEDIPMQIKVVLGDPATMIASLAAKQPIDLVVLSSHEYTGVKRWIMGSVAEQVVHHTLKPVLFLHSQKPLRVHRSPDGTSFVRALVPLDTSTDSLAAIIPAARIVSALSAPGQGEVHLAHVVAAPETESMPEIETRLQAARREFEITGQSVRESMIAGDDADLHIALTWAVTLEREIAEGIVRRAEHGEKHEESETAKKCDLIVIPTHDASGRQKWAVNSITERVLHATHLPVLVVHPTGAIVENDLLSDSQTSTAKEASTLSN